MEFQELEPELYRWQASRTNPRTIERRGIGTEAWVGIKDENFKGQYDLFLNATLRAKCEQPIQSLSLGALKTATILSLVELRYEHPESAGTARWEDQSPFLQYTPPENTAEAMETAESAVELWLTCKTYLEVRKEIGHRRKQPGSPYTGHTRSVEVHLISNVADENTPLSLDARIDMLLHMNHMYWDGISARMFLGSILQKIQGFFAGKKQFQEIEWGTEIKNLPEPILDASKVKVETLAKDFEDAREEFVGSLMAFANSWALDQQLGVGAPSTEILKFTLAESQSILQAVNLRLGPGYTISHLGQAATALALLKAKPIPDELGKSPDIVMPLPVNGRRYLKDEFVESQYGTCQAGAVVQLQDAKSFVVNDTDQEAVVAMLERACRISKEQYDYWLSKPFQMAVNVSKDHFLANLLSSTPQERSTTAVPIFISDGVNDRYVSLCISDIAKNGFVLDVEDVAFFTDSFLPGLLVRMESWRGVTSLGLSFNDGTFTARDAVQFLTYTMDYMRMFAR